MTGKGVWPIVRDLRRGAGIARPVWPHALRHQAITQALDAIGGDLRILLRYDDRRRDPAGDVARMAAGE